MLLCYSGPGVRNREVNLIRGSKRAHRSCREGRRMRAVSELHVGRPAILNLILLSDTYKKLTTDYPYLIHDSGSLRSASTNSSGCLAVGQRSLSGCNFFSLFRLLTVPLTL